MRAMRPGLGMPALAPSCPRDTVSSRLLPVSRVPLRGVVVKKVLVTLVLVGVGLVGGSGEAQEPASTPATPTSSPAAPVSPPAVDPTPVAPNSAAPTANEPSTAASTAKTAPADTLVCRRERETGSRMTREVCRTRAQIQAQQKDAEEMKRLTLEKGNRRNAGG